MSKKIGQIALLEKAMKEASDKADYGKVSEIATALVALKSSKIADSGSASKTPEEMGEALILKALDKVAKDPGHIAKGWRGLDVRMGEIPGEGGGFTINQGLSQLCGLKTREDRVKLTLRLQKEGKIDILPVSYTSAKGNKIGSVRLYLKGQMPERRTTETAVETSFADFMGS